MTPPIPQHWGWGLLGLPSSFPFTLLKQNFPLPAHLLLYTTSGLSILWTLPETMCCIWSRIQRSNRGRTRTRQPTPPLLPTKKGCTPPTKRQCTQLAAQWVGNVPNLFQGRAMKVQFQGWCIWIWVWIWVWLRAWARRDARTQTMIRFVSWSMKR